MAATFLDINADGNLDLYVASGGYHNLNPQDQLQLDRVYFGDGTGNFSRKKDALPAIKGGTTSIAADDINGDGFPDLFVERRSGTRKVP